MRVVPYGLSDVGLGRPTNEDRFVIRGLPRGQTLLAVADGIGGQRAGEVAAAVAAAAFADALAARLRAGQAVETAVEESLREANAAVIRAADRPEREGMGTTLSAAVVGGGAAVIGHVGDSRVYLVRGGRARLLTRDDSIAAELVRHGDLTADEAAAHAGRGILTQALGGEIEPQILTITLLPDDRLVVCSDGLSNLVEGDEIAALAASHAADRAAQRLVGLATDRGAPDNVTVVVAEIRRVRRRSPLVAAAALTLLVGALGAAAWGVQRSYFLGIERGRVAVYRGVPVEVLGVRLYRVEQTTGVEEASLPPLYRQRLDEGIIVRDLDEARSIVRDLVTGRGP